MVIFGEPLKHVITLCGQILVSRKLAIRDDPNIRLRCSRNVEKHLFTVENTPVCPFKTSRVYVQNVPCMPAQRAHVLKHVCALCRHTRGRFERTHGDVLNGHTGVFSRCHTTHKTPQHKTQHHTETDRDNRRRRGDEREEDKTRDKSREKREE